MKGAVQNVDYFTFHNVSINTGCDSCPCTTSIFTFHNVSINTCIKETQCVCCKPLHSTMFLLIPAAGITFEYSNYFTFHNVSINTSLCGTHGRILPSFTFHNVSINTNKDLGAAKENTLYIPQCFY